MCACAFKNGQLNNKRPADAGRLLIFAFFYFHCYKKEDSNYFLIKIYDGFSFSGFIFSNW